MKEKLQRSISASNAPEPAGCGPTLPVHANMKPLRQQVFESVRAAGQISRIDVAKNLGVSPGSVTQMTAELISMGLVEEVETPSQHLRGRPPVALSVKVGAGYVVGLKLGDFSHSAVIVDFAGMQIAELDCPSAARKMEADALIDEAEALWRAILDKSAVLPKQVAAVGLGLAGMVDHDAGTVPWSPLLRERGVDLRALASARLGVPVHIDNDANMLTLAELWFGAGRGKSAFAVVTIEYGVGMGLVLDNRLYRGALGLGMELGHTKVQLDGALCRCGNRGCLEAYVADYALVREARVALDMPPDKAGHVGALLETLYDQAKAGNEQARTIFRRAGRYLSLGLSNVVHLFDPELIILSGERMRYDYLYAEDVLAEMKSLTLDNGRVAPQIDIHVWGGYVWARGGAALALSAVTDTMFGEAAEA
ncbi:ROK family transcriptional regulator [Litoreibacter roseus]|uniref:Xylose operon repressor n=1 Tax=Litoreibacter roseus TaxID=2601869 RepID=A0A6N6JIH2_9RHOB|nr:ROK family transcriptional regulator [Litoreibacter roseus]GFE66141.1 xylose operon repressor [Litoreibacter roseus]